MTARTFECPKCGGPIPLGEDAGKSVTCPFCNSTIIVPEELRAPVAPAPVHVEVQPPPPRIETVPQAELARKRQSPLAIFTMGIGIWWVLSAVFVFISCVVCTIVAYSQQTYLVVANHSGVRICSVMINETGRRYRREYLDRDFLDYGESYKDNLSAGDYDITAYDCDGNLLAEEKNLTLPAGDFTWTISPP